MQIPGPPGTPGAPGAAGADGIDAFTVTSSNYTQPAVSGSVSVHVADSSWAANGQVVYVTTGGYYTVTGIADGTHLTLTNLGYSGNAAPAVVISSPQQVSPGGLKGVDGSSGSTTLNQISPSTTKGDMLADNGANNPLASIVRLAVGTNGKALVADSAQPSGVGYATITPNSVTNANNIPRFSGTSGTPMAVKDSGLLITDDGAIQSTPTGGNARGSKAVDLQVDRTAVANVASGAFSVVAGGYSNKASNTFAAALSGTLNVASGVGSGVCFGTSNVSSGTASAIVGGASNSSSNSYSFIGAGSNNIASGANSSAVSGDTNISSGQNASICGGQNNTASAQNAAILAGANNASSGVASSILGGNLNTAGGPASSIIGGSQGLTDKHGQITHASGAFANQGDAQTSELLYRISTTDATANVELFLDGASLRAVIGTNITWGFEIWTTVRTSAGISVLIRTIGAIQNNAGTVSLVAAVSQSVISDGSGATITTANLTVDADNGNKALRIRCTGLAATNIRWISHARIFELGY